jgi:5-(carboxyamino)imidazole ribonucleotide mutase
LKKLNFEKMEPKVSIIMGSMSDLAVMEAAARILDEFEIPFEINALSAHRTPEAVEIFAKDAKTRGIQVIIAAAGMAAHLPGVIAAMTTLPVIGVPINASLSGLDSLLAIVQMPSGIPVATVGINGAQNAGILADQILALADFQIVTKLDSFKENLKLKIEKANGELAEIKFKYKTN